MASRRRRRNKPLDYTDFKTEDPAKPSAPEPASPSPQTRERWWNLDADAAAQDISDVIDSLRDAQEARLTTYASAERFYGNLILVGLTSGHAGASVNRLAAKPDRDSFNVIQSGIDTLVSKCAKNRPRPYFLTSGGNYHQRRKAKKLNKFVDGTYYENKFYDLLAEEIRDALVYGNGPVHVFARNGRVAMERVIPSELWVDEVDAKYGKPRQMHRVKFIDRDVLLERYPDSRDEIIGADAAGVDGGDVGAESDLVEVRESWHLPSKKGAKDGKHILTIDAHALTPMLPWLRDSFPFANLRWTPRLAGFWAQGAAEQLSGIQLAINRISRLISRSLDLGGTYKILLPMGSKVSKEKLDNGIGAIIEHNSAPGMKPEYILPPIVQPELYREREVKKQEGYEQIGISQMSAASVKPPGDLSGKALREYNDTETERFLSFGKEIERFSLDVAHLSIATAREIAAGGEEFYDEEGKTWAPAAKGVAKDVATDPPTDPDAPPRKRRSGSYVVKVPTRSGFSEIDWRDIDLDDDAYVMQCFAVSKLPTDPAGRLKDVQEYMQAGVLTLREGRRLLDFPDLDQIESLANAAEEYLTKVLDGIVDDDEYTVLEPLDDLQLAKELTLQVYQEGKAHGLEDERLEKLRRVLGQIKWLEKQATLEAAADAAAMAPPPVHGPAAGPAPIAAPMPPPTSGLLPNAPAPATVQ